MFATIMHTNRIFKINTLKYYLNLYNIKEPSDTCITIPAWLKE